MSASRIDIGALEALAPEFPHLVRELSAQIKPLLAGQPSPVQGAALADLLAIWLASHADEGGVEQTKKLRADLLAGHLAHVEMLIDLYAKQFGTPTSG